MRVILFSLLTRFQLGTSPPRGTVGCAVFPFRVGFRLFVSPPRHAGGPREGFDVGFPCHSACVLLQPPFFVSLPPPRRWRLAGVFFALVCFIIALFFVSPPRHAGGTRKLFNGGLSYYSACVFLQFFFFVFFLAS